MANQKNKNQVINPDVLNDNVKGLYSKGMSHDSNTLVGNMSEVKELQIAMLSAEQSDFNSITKAANRKQVNPQAGLSDERAVKVSDLTMPVPPAVASREAASEMLEVYEMALLRDKSFADIESESPDADVQRALNTLNAFGSDFKGPKVSGSVTSKSLFRGIAPNELVGPYVSQFLYHPVPLGAHNITQQYIPRTGSYGISESDFLKIQNGTNPGVNGLPTQTTSSARYCATPRDIGSVVHVDFVYQQFLYAAAILFSRGASVTQPRFPSLSKEAGFITYGGPVDLAAALGEVTRIAMKATWMQKWFYHLRIRPEGMAGLVVKQDNSVISEAVHADIFTDGVNTIDAVKAVTSDGEAWLPLQFAEGSPTHPSYPAGHAAIAGACVTLLKLYFGDAAWSSTGLSALHSTNGSSLVSYTKDDASSMTIHGELNKLASNIAIGRNMAGVHYRSDGDKGVQLGEAAAIAWFKSMKKQINESTNSITLVKFDGSSVSI